MKLSTDQDLVTLETLADVIARSQIIVENPADRAPPIFRPASMRPTLPSLTGSLRRRVVGPRLRSHVVIASVPLLTTEHLLKYVAPY